MVSLHDANGAYVAEALTDQDMSQPGDREFVIDLDGQIYVWNYRYGQWRESAGVITVGHRGEFVSSRPLPMPNPSEGTKTGKPADKD